MNDPIESLYLALEAAALDSAPEAVSVLVVGTDDLLVAAEVAPMLAARLYPTRAFGRCLHIERASDGMGWQAAVEALR